MNAPETAVAVASLPLAHITPSPSNPRKHFDEAYLAELAGTIKDHGVLQPITVRPNPRHKVGKPIYEIVVGECRWRAAKIAGLTEIPAFWRELDDRQVLEIQIVENLQRRDVHPLEEAEGYEQLMKRHGYTAEQLAEKIGKSKAYIYARLKLCALDAPARKAFYEGKLNPSTALLIARIPVPALQTEAMKEITAQNFRGEPMSYRGAAEHIQDRYMLRLDEAPFPRTDCAGCPKRTGNQKDLFPDVKSGDVCTDPACFDERKQAHAERLRAEAESRGQQIIEGKSAKKIMPSRHTLPNDGDYVALDATCYDDDKYRSWRKLLGKDAPTPALLVNPHTPGELIEVLPRATIAEHLKAKGIDIAKKPARNTVSDEQKKRERKAKIENAWRGRVFDAVRSHLTQDFDANQRTTEARQLTLEEIELRWVAVIFFGHLGFDAQKRLARLWIGPTDKKQDDHALIADFRKRLSELPAADHGRLLIEMALVGDTFAGTWNLDHNKPERLLEAAQAYDIDAEAIKKAVVAEFKAKEKTKTAAKASPPTPAAQARGKKAGGKKPKAKADPAPASPAEETAPAAPGKAKPGLKTSLNPAAAWPMQNHGEAATDAAPAPQESTLTKTTWPFPTGSRPA